MFHVLYLSSKLPSFCFSERSLNVAFFLFLFFIRLASFRSYSFFFSSYIPPLNPFGGGGEVSSHDWGTGDVMVKRGLMLVGRDKLCFAL